jgi:periplasmic mercuric ion binding protein
MKTLKLLFVAVLAFALGTTVSAQTKDHTMAMTKTETFKVSGKCEMCKARIEKTANLDGVTKAVWSEKTKMLTIAYNPSKVKIDDIQKKLAAVGHDTPKYKATATAYNALPGCCKYR